MTATVARAWCEREGLAAPDRVQPAPHGTLAGFRERAGRLHRVVEFDRHGTLLSVLAWGDHGRLVSARVRLPDGGWLTLEPRAVVDPRWGVSDRLSSASGPLTHFEAVAWGAVDRIPVLAEPARVPPGGGVAVLNLLATLAVDQARPSLAYHGPYPTEALFLSLLESFRPQPPGGADPLAAFVQGGLPWSPAPHERLFDPAMAVVHLRGRVEKVTVDGRAYYRPDWHGIIRHAPRRVRDLEGQVACSLWALGAPLEDHLILEPSGAVVERRQPAASGDTWPFPPVLVDGTLAVLVATSAAPLAEALADTAAALRFEWGPVRGDLVESRGGTVRVSGRLLAVARARAAALAGRADHLALATATLVEIAQLIGDDLRRRAQARLAAAAPETQAAALTRATAAGGAREIAAAVEALAAQLVA